MSGWVKIHRKISGNPLWTAEKFTDGQAWVDLILLANHSAGYIKVRGIRIEIPPGCLGWSELKLAERWQWSRGKVRRFLFHLCSENMIKMEQQKNKVTTLISIVNYNEYQGNGTTNGTTNGQQTVQQTDTNKNNKKNKNEKNHSVRKFEIPTIEQVKAYFQENGYSAEAGERAWKYYDAGNWHDSSGKPVLSWKQKMRVNWFKDQDKIQSYKLPKNPKEPLE